MAAVLGYMLIFSLFFLFVAAGWIDTDCFREFHHREPRNAGRCWYIPFLALLVLPAANFLIHSQCFLDRHTDSPKWRRIGGDLICGGIVGWAGFAVIDRNPTQLYAALQAGCFLPLLHRSPPGSRKWKYLAVFAGGTGLLLTAGAMSYFYASLTYRYACMCCSWHYPSPLIRATFEAPGIDGVRWPFLLAAATVLNITGCAAYFRMAGKLEKVRFFTPFTIGLLSLNLALYATSLAAALQVELRNVNLLHELKNRFGYDLTPAAAQQRYLSGGKPDRDYWQRQADLEQEFIGASAPPTDIFDPPKRDPEKAFAAWKAHFDSEIPLIPFDFYGGFPSLPYPMFSGTERLTAEIDRKVDAGNFRGALNDYRLLKKLADAQAAFPDEDTAGYWLRLEQLRINAARRMLGSKFGSAAERNEIRDGFAAYPARLEVLADRLDYFATCNRLRFAALLFEEERPFEMRALPAATLGWYFPALRFCMARELHAFLQTTLAESSRPGLLSGNAERQNYLITLVLTSQINYFKSRFADLARQVRELEKMR